LIRRLRCPLEESAITRSSTLPRHISFAPLHHRWITGASLPFGDHRRPPELPPPAGIRPLPCRPHPGEHFLVVPYLSSTPCATHPSPLMPRSLEIWPPGAPPVKTQAVDCRRRSTIDSDRCRLHPFAVSISMCSPRPALFVSRSTLNPSSPEPLNLH
jgi:hypothetical protein